MKKKTKNQLRKYIFMGSVFLIAMIVYAILSYQTMEKSNTVYSSLSEARLPLVYVEKEDRSFNRMYGYMQDMGENAEQDMLTVLPEDRRLQLRVEERGSSVASIQYEIRSLDLSQLIEKGNVEAVENGNEDIRFSVPVQNLIQRGQQYLLKLTVNIPEHSIHYYSRIVWLQNDFSEELLQLAEDFSRKSFSKSEARDLSAYLESRDTADNSSLSHVTLHSSFQQLTFGNTGMQPASEFYLRLKELNGVMGEVQVQYLSICADQNGEQRSFWTEDNFVFRYDPQRIFLMNFDRKMEEEIGAAHFEDSRLLLGVQNEEHLESMQCSSGQFTAFKAGKGLFRYDSSNHGRFLKLFSFDSERDSRALTKNSYDMRILSVKNNGDVDFIVYGYMNRGQHEGYSGILYYTYDNSEDTVVENFFLPIADSAARIGEDMQRLSYINENGLFYFYYDGSIYGIDTNSFEVVTVTEGLEDWEFVSTESSQYLAFQDPKSNNSYESKNIRFMDLSRDFSTELRQEGSYLRVLGFIGSDFIYGLSPEDMAGKKDFRCEVPMSELRIVDEAQNMKTDYQKDGIYFGNAKVSESRIHFDEYRYQGESFQYIGDDSIISNRENSSNRRQGFQSYHAGELQKCWYLEIPELGKRRPGMTRPAKYSIEKSSAIELPNSNEEKEAAFYAYSLGKYQGKYRTLEEAYQKVYEDFGYIKDEKGRMLWNRTDKQTIVRLRNTIEKAAPLQEKLPELSTRTDYGDVQLLNAYGMDLNSVLYYVGKGIPAVAYSETGSYELIVGYNQFNITMADPVTGSEYVLGREEASQRFADCGNRFAVMVAN